jgi:predicted phage-related endonuclease
MSLTSDQLAMRRTGITASDAVILSGTVPFKKRKTVYDLWMDKCCPELVKPAEYTEAMELGHEAEPVIVRRVAKKRGLIVVYPQTTVRHASIEWAMATPDAKIVGNDEVGDVVGNSNAVAYGLIECKLVGVYVARHWGVVDEDNDESDGPPDYVYTQSVWQMFVTGLPYCIVAAMIGTEVRTYRIDFDKEAAEYASALVELGDRFRKDHVLTRRPPPIDGSESSRNMLAELFPKAGTAQVRADEEAEAAARSYFEGKRQEKAAKELQDNAKTALMAKIQGNYGVVGDGWRCNWVDVKGYHVDAHAYDVEARRKFDLRKV